MKGIASIQKQQAMKGGKNNRKLCPEGHIFFKSSDCPVCPVCEKKRKTVLGWMSALSAPAKRALENNGLTSLHKIAACTEKEILSLHGIGPSALPKLKSALLSAGLHFKQTTSNHE